MHNQKIKKMQNKLAINNHYQQQGLKGFFSWLKKTVNKISVQLKANGVPFMGILDDFTNGDGKFFGFKFGNYFAQEAQTEIGTGFKSLNGVLDTDLPLTAIEESYLDTWVDQNVIPFTANYINKIKALAYSSPTLLNFGTVYNEVSMLTAFVEWYSVNYQNYSNSATSLNVVKTQIALLQVNAAIIQEQLDIYIANASVSLTTETVSSKVSTSLNFNGLGVNIPGSIQLTHKKLTAVNLTLVEAPIETVGNETPVVIEEPITTTPGITNEDGSSIATKSVLLFAAGFILNKLFSNNN